MPERAAEAPPRPPGPAPGRAIQPSPRPQTPPSREPRAPSSRTEEAVGPGHRGSGSARWTAGRSCGRLAFLPAASHRGWCKPGAVGGARQPLGLEMVRALRASGCSSGLSPRRLPPSGAAARAGEGVRADSGVKAAWVHIANCDLPRLRICLIWEKKKHPVNNSAYLIGLLRLHELIYKTLAVVYVLAFDRLHFTSVHRAA